MKDMENAEKRLQEIQGHLDNGYPISGGASLGDQAVGDIKCLLAIVKSKDGHIAELEEGLLPLIKEAQEMLVNRGFGGRALAIEKLDEARNLLTKEGKL